MGKIDYTICIDSILSTKKTLIIFISDLAPRRRQGSHGVVRGRSVAGKVQQGGLHLHRGQQKHPQNPVKIQKKKPKKKIRIKQSSTRKISRRF